MLVVCEMALPEAETIAINKSLKNFPLLTDYHCLVQPTAFTTLPSQVPD